MADDDLPQWADDPDSVGSQPGRPAGMPPVTGDYVDRDDDAYAKQLGATQPDGVARRHQGLPSRKLQIGAVAFAVALAILVPLLTRDAGTSGGSNSNRDTPVNVPSVDELCSGPLLELLEEQASQTTSDDGLPPPGSSLQRMCDNLSDAGALDLAPNSDE